MAENMGTEMVVANQTMDIVSKEEKNNSAIMSTPSALHLNEEKESTQKWNQRVLFLFFISIIPVVLFGVIFTSPMGKGVPVLEALCKRYHLFVPLCCTGFLYFFVLYIFDVSYWNHGCLPQLRRIALFIGGLFILFAVMLSAKAFPGVPCAAFLLSVPVFFYHVRKLCYADVPVAHFLTSLAPVCLAWGVIGLVSFVIYLGVTRHQYWNRLTRNEYIYRLQYACVDELNAICDIPENILAPNATTGARCAAFGTPGTDNFTWYYCHRNDADSTSVETSIAKSVYNASLLKAEKVCALDVNATAVPVECYCLSAFLLWNNHFIACGMTIVFGAIAFYLGWSLNMRVDQLDFGFKLLATICTISFLGFWVAAEVAVTSIRIANAIFLFSAINLIAITTLVVSTVGWELLNHKMMQVAIVKRISNSLFSDFSKGLLTISFGPIFAIFCAFSFVNQCVRNCLKRHKMLECFEKEKNEEIERGENVSENGNENSTETYFLTEIFRKHIASIQQWKLTLVLTNVVWIGIAFWVIFVGVGKITNVFLSWLNVALSEMHIAAVLVIFYAVGLFLFLLPPVPGIPVYVTGGVTIVDKLERDVFGTSTSGYLCALLIVIAICFVLKLNAIAVQQKCFGEYLGKNVYIRKTCAVNSDAIKAIRVILTRPGLSAAKVCILVGGPDWPTSVLTGILHLNLWEMLYGSLPCIFVVSSCVLSGSFLVKAGEGGIWEPLSGVTVALTIAAQMVIMLIAAYLIEEVCAHEQDKIRAIADDEEVKELERQEEEYLRVHKENTDWHASLSRYGKGILFTSALSMTISCHLQQGFSNLCWKEFEVTDTIDEKLNGNVWNMIGVPVGWVSIGFFVLSIVCFSIHQNFAHAKTLSVMNNDEENNTHLINAEKENVCLVKEM